LQGIFVCEGTRSRAIHQQQYEYIYLFGAVYAALGQAVGLVLPIIFSYQMRFYSHLATATEKQWG